MVARSLSTKLGPALIVLALVAAVPATAVEWEIGDVIVGVSGGRYQVYDKDGNFKQTITSGSGFTTGCAFDEDGNLYTTYFSSGQVRVFDGAEPHGLIQTIATGTSQPESVVFAEDGTFYVGHAGFNYDILKYAADGTFITRYDVPRGPRGSDWIDLAADQTTMYYTSEGRQVRRYDLGTSTALSDFALIPGGGVAYAFRLLPPGDGTGGVLVADTGNIKRFNGAGALIQTYDAPGEGTWFALNLDADGTSFWSGNFGSGNFYKFDIATGAILLGPINTGTGSNTLFGICVLGEITAAINNPPVFTSPDCGTTIQVDPGNEVSFTVTATDDPTQTVTLTSTPLPAGATMNPPLPTSGNPVSSDFSWTPDASFENTTQTIVFTASDGEKEAECRVSIEIGEDLLIVLQSFEAIPGDGENVLEWTTELEVDNAGFYLLRRSPATGEVVRINDGLIPARGDLFETTDYTYVDDTAINGVEYQYILVDLDLSGLETFHEGNFVVTNPQSPAIKLIAPAYGTDLDLKEAPAFEWQPRSLRQQLLTFSFDPTFTNAAEAVTVTVRGTRQGEEAFRLGARDLARLQALIQDNLGEPLYWQVSESTLGSRVNVSDVFRLDLDPGAFETSDPSQDSADDNTTYTIGDRSLSGIDADSRIRRPRGTRDSRR